MARVYAGTSGWAYTSWKPAFYPPKLASTKFLEYYGTRLNSVEVNYSFRRLVGRSVYEKWVAGTPAEFKFAIKAHQRITHIKRLRDLDDILPAFLTSITPLHEAGRLGPVLFQLPPNMKKDVDLLVDFLSHLPRTLQAAIEFRHESWLADDVYEVLRKFNTAICTAESEKLSVPHVATASFCYYRFRRPDYTPKERAELANKVLERTAEGRDVFAFFKHEETPDGALFAEELLKATSLKESKVSTA